ncbi:MAG: 2-oxo acid dehydrogenase subunit E2, partial [Phaeodactylibacter sp.]|nr:2-oxo acid dehydrogenase subunit E2 [Phaeodactylibacter sp.]
MSIEVKIPKISEDADTGTVAEIYVSEGDVIEEGQDIIALDSDKASVNVPSDASGKVSSIKMEEGQEVHVGDVILILEEVKEKHKGQKSSGKKEKKKQEDSKKKEPEPEAPKKKESEEKKPSEAGGKESRDKKKKSKKKKKKQKKKRQKREEATPSAPLAKKFARELGISLSELETDGPEGRITREDVMEHARRIIESKTAPHPSPETVQNGIKPIELPDFSQWGETERRPLSSVRSVIAENTTRSWQNIPHVTHHDKAELSALEDFLRQMEQDEGQKLSMTALITKISVEALKKFPKFNASLDLKKEEIVFKKYYHISIAVDTDDGLLMPVIRDVGQKPIGALSEELSELAEKARGRKLQPEEMEGG